MLTDEGIGSGADGTLTLPCLPCAMASEEPLHGVNGEAVSTSVFHVTAIPFATWGNRAPGAMRVWLPARWRENRQIADGQLFAEIPQPEEAQ